jgi:hypothetical protein
LACGWGCKAGFAALAASHLLGDFECGAHTLDDWRKRRAMSNQLSGASRTFVVVDEENRVRGSMPWPLARFLTNWQPAWFAAIWRDSPLVHERREGA